MKGKSILYLVACNGVMGPQVQKAQASLYMYDELKIYSVDVICVNFALILCSFK